MTSIQAGKTVASDGAQCGALDRSVQPVGYQPELRCIAPAYR